MIYQNYHKHTMYSNVRVPDSVASYAQYAEKAKEYGHSILSSVEHGWQGRYIEAYEIAHKEGLKLLFGTETYFVFDRKIKDATNSHMILLAKNENGRKAINRVLSEANVSGFYYQPRVDLELVLSLPPKDVWVTTACLAGPLKYTQERWNKLVVSEPSLEENFWLLEEPYIYIIRSLHKHFKDNFFLEVQSHQTPTQKTANSILRELSYKLGIKLMAGVDSHYISNDKAWERDEYLSSRGLHYEDEEGWFMDYPSGQVLFNQFQGQGVLSDKEITEAISNTNIFLQVEEYNSPVFDDEIKMPILPMYKHLTQTERNSVFEELVWEKWQEEKHFVSEERQPLYEKEISKEIDIVIPTGLADYFLLDYQLIKLGKEKGGRLTYTGRGSAAGFYLNHLLGFTSIDRISSAVTLYPERFLSKTRILESKSLPDIDMNCGNTTPFVEAQEELLGKGHAYPMVAFGTYKVKSAWKLFAKAQDISFDLATAVGKQLDEYLEDLKNASEDEKDSIDATDYISEEYQDIFNKSSVYRDIIASISIHPCSHILTELDVPSEIGLMQVNDNLCCIMDGKWADSYNFLKNDLLTVSVVEFIGRTFERINVPQLTARELLAICDEKHPCWEIYKNSWTVGINQCEQPSSKHKAAIYKPRNISELAAFVAAIRPGFKSMYSTFEKRKSFSYGIPTIDALIQTPQFPQSFMLYQEQAMLLLNYAGIPLDETYTIIKAIAKKKAEKIQQYKKIFLEGMAKRIVESERESLSKAKEVAQNVWQIISDSQRYSFNSCLAGSTIIPKVGGKNGRFIPTIEEMYYIKNSIEYAKKTGHIDLYKKYKRLGYGMAFSLFLDGKIRSNKIVDIRFSGYRQTYKLTTESGIEVICTDNHKFPTPDGEKELSQLRVNDFLYKTGQYEKCSKKYLFTDGNYEGNCPSIGQIGFQKRPEGDSVVYHEFRAKAVANKDACFKCGKVFSLNRRFEVHHKDFDRTHNEETNYDWLCCSCHKKVHYGNGRTTRYEKGSPVILDKIISIILWRQENVYDVEMMDPNHNLVVNEGLVVSNSHALAVAIDSLYGAYLKATYPLAFYETYLRVMEENNKKDKMLAAQQEAIEAYGINFTPMRLGQDNRQIVSHPKDNSITSSIQSLKGFSRRISYALYSMKDFAFEHFTDLLFYAKKNTPINTSHMDILISLNYFNRFGGNAKLLKIHELFNGLYDAEKMVKDLSSKVVGKLDIPQDFLLGACDRVETREREYFYVLDKKEFIQVEGEVIANSYGLRLFQTKDDRKWNICDIDTGIILFSVLTKARKKHVDEYIEANNMINKLSRKINNQRAKGLLSPKTSLPESETKYYDTRYFSTDLHTLLVLCENAAVDEILPLKQQVQREVDYLSYISSTYDFLPKKYCVVESLDIKYKPRVNLYSLKNGNRFEARIPAKIFNKTKIRQFDIISIEGYEQTQAWNPPDADGNFTRKPGVYETSLLDYFKLDDIKLQASIEKKIERGNKKNEKSTEDEESIETIQ